MIKQSKKVKEFEEKLLVKENLSYKEKLRIIDALWKEALHLKVINPSNILDGIEADIRIARAINTHK